MTPYPWISSHSLSIRTWVERPTPSVPSIVIRVPRRSRVSAYGRPWPKNCPRGASLPPAIMPSAPASEPPDDLPDLLLLMVDAPGAVDDPQAILGRHPVVLLQHPPLEQPEALDRVLAQAEIHAGLVKLDLRARSEDPADGDVDRHPVDEGRVRPHRERIKIAHPARVDAAGDVAREGGVDIPIRQHRHAGLEIRDDLVGEAVREVGGVQQAEGAGGQEVLLLAALGRLAHQVGGVPLGEEDLMPARLEPFVQQLDLGALPRPVDPLDDDQLATRARSGRRARNFDSEHLRQFTPSRATDKVTNR